MTIVIGVTLYFLLELHLSIIMGSERSRVEQGDTCPHGYAIAKGRQINVALGRKMCKAGGGSN
jgi:hypothetical protein